MVLSPAGWVGHHSMPVRSSEGIVVTGVGVALCRCMGDMALDTASWAEKNDAFCATLT